MAEPARRRRKRAVVYPTAEDPGLKLAERLEGLRYSLGNNQVAEMLGVSKSQPSRWSSGKDKITPENQRRLIDLDYVMTRLLRVCTPQMAAIWLASYNPHLRGVPAHVLQLEGARAVIEAIDLHEAGAYV